MWRIFTWVKAKLAGHRAAIEADAAIVGGATLNGVHVVVAAAKLALGTQPGAAMIGGLLDDLQTFIDQAEPHVLEDLHAALAQLPQVQAAVVAPPVVAVPTAPSPSTPA